MQKMSKRKKKKIVLQVLGVRKMKVVVPKMMKMKLKKKTGKR